MSELFAKEADSKPIRTCKDCEHRERWECGSKVIQCCGIRKSGSTVNGLLKIKCNLPACELISLKATKKKINRVAIHAKFNGRCAYCGSDIMLKEMQVDHIESKFHNGSNGIENLNPSCRACNFYKSGEKLEFFRHKLTTLHERLLDIFIVRLALKYGILKLNDWTGKFYFEQQGENQQ